MHVLGDVFVSTQSAYELDLMNSAYSEIINQGEEQNDPLSLTLYNYYLELQTKLAEEEEKQSEIDDYQQYLQEQRDMAYELFQQILVKLNFHLIFKK